MNGIAAVLGAGTMGHGIAQVLAQAGYEVRLRDLERERLEAALGKVQANLEGAVARGKLPADQVASILGRIRVETELEAALAGAHIVVEAIPEDLELKKRVLAEVSAVAPTLELVGTNTSSLPVTEIAQATAAPERVVGLHFFNPVHLSRLVEVVAGERTAPETTRAAVSLVEALGKQPIVVRDAPGFASSRLGLVLGLEAMRMLEQGVADAEAIDRAMELGYRHPMGPLKTTDYVGLDVRLAIAEHLHREVGEAFRPPYVLRRLVRAGKLGRKSGEGFYRWSPEGECLGPA
ncbi:MAG: 3-hydroxyacyl-CoA dehydrogenase family protein [Planctomycetota bacterium]|nr:MAG: 3-hydroxyacyl-CoA dehydrogenase family protein [Planctomycetota bacterium]